MRRRSADRVDLTLMDTLGDLLVHLAAPTRWSCLLLRGLLPLLLETEDLRRRRLCRVVVLSSIHAVTGSRLT